MAFLRLPQGNTNFIAEITFGADALDQMSVFNFLQQAKLRGLVIFRNNRLLLGSELRARIARRDTALNHVNFAQKTEYARFGAVTAAEIRELLAKKKGFRSVQAQLLSQHYGVNYAFMLD